MKQPKNCLAMASAIICLDSGAWSMIFAVWRMLVLQHRFNGIKIASFQDGYEKAHTSLHKPLVRLCL